MTIDHIAQYYRKRWEPLRHAASSDGGKMTVLCRRKEVVDDGWYFMEWTKAVHLGYGVTCPACRRDLPYFAVAPMSVDERDVFLPVESRCAAR